MLPAILCVGAACYLLRRNKKHKERIRRNGCGRAACAKRNVVAHELSHTSAGHQPAAAIAIPRYQWEQRQADTQASILIPAYNRTRSLQQSPMAAYTIFDGYLSTTRR
jgi:hypothetical protein